MVHARRRSANGSITRRLAHIDGVFSLSPPLPCIWILVKWGSAHSADPFPPSPLFSRGGKVVPFKEG